MCTPPYFEDSYLDFANTLKISPIHRTTEVDTTIEIQSFKESGTTLKNSPPISTIAIWPTKIKRRMIINPLQPLKLKADFFDSKALALNIFQN